MEACNTSRSDIYSTDREGVANQAENPFAVNNTTNELVSRFNAGEEDPCKANFAQ